MSYRLLLTTFAISLGLLFVGCTDAPDTTDDTAANGGDFEQAESPDIDLPNAVTLFDSILIGGQPTQDHLREAADRGYQTVVNLRPPGEFTDWDQEALVSELGMQYENIPVAGEADITEENARQLADILDNDDNHPILMHCSSGNRVGALFAARAHYLNDEDPDVALEQGREAGLTALEEELRERWMV